MSVSSVAKKISLTSLTASFITLGIAMAGTQAQATTLFNDRTTFQNNLSTFIVDDYENPGYKSGNIANTPTLDIFTDAAMSSVFGETKYKTTTPFNSPNGYNLISERSAGNDIYCAGCNGSFILDFTQTTVGNALGVFGAGFDILSRTDYFARVTFGDNSIQDFSLAGKSFWGLTSEKSIKTVNVGLQGGLPTTNGSIQIDNLTIGANATKSVPEPASVLGLLAFGAFGANSLLKRKQTKAVVKA
jgi:hypothetical protein